MNDLSPELIAPERREGSEYVEDEGSEYVEDEESESVEDEEPVDDEDSVDDLRFLFPLDLTNRKSSNLYFFLGALCTHIIWLYQVLRVTPLSKSRHSG